MAQGICSIEGCTTHAYCRGWCRMHYVRWQRHGDPLKIKLIVGDDVRRFWSKVNVGAQGGCWEWMGCRAAGYGRFSVNRRARLAHRYAYELLVGPIPSHLQPDHLCRNTGCVNPEHLELVTPAENNRRSMGPAAINARKTHCVHGHEFTPENTYVNKEGHRRCRTCNRLRYVAKGSRAA